MGVLLLVRHGQASFGADDYDVLSETGWQQSRLLGAWLAERGVVPDVILHGSMRRQRETGEGLVAGAGWSVPLEQDARWNEFDHLGVVAAYPGLPTGEVDRAEFQRVFERATARWTGADAGLEAGPDAGLDYPESFGGFVARVRAAMRDAARRSGPGATVVAVSSGGVIAAAVALLVAAPSDGTPGDRAGLATVWSRLNTVVVNSSVTRVVVGSTGARLLSFNEHPHLEGETLTYR